MSQTINMNGYVSSIEIEPDEYLLPLLEAIVNSIQSIEDNTEEKEPLITIKVLRGKQLDLGEEIKDSYRPIEGFELFDNGVGFTDIRFNAFNEAFTDINREKGCKGVGRYTVLACFGNMEIESNFKENGSWNKRVFKYDLKHGSEPEKNNIKPSTEEKCKTIVRLNRYKKNFHEYIVKEAITLETIAEDIIEHCLLYFITGKVPVIRLYNEGEVDKAINLNDFYKQIIKFDKEGKSLKLKNIKAPFKISYIRNYKDKSHSFHLCANKREVGKKVTVSTYIPSFVKSLVDSDTNKYHLSVYVTGDFLDEKANNQRNKFSIPLKIEDKKTFDDTSLEELFKEISGNVRSEYSEWITTADLEKTERIHDYILDPKRPRLEYKHLLSVEGIFEDIPGNATDERLETELHKKVFLLEQKRNKAFDRAFTKKKYDKQEFSEIIHNVLAEEAAFSFGKLADMMVRRKSVLKLFRKYLEWRKEDNYMLEEDLHNIIFTMGAETKSMPKDYHNLWLLDERLTFHNYTTSDKQFRTNPHIGSISQKESDLLIYDFPWAYSDNPNNINSLVVFEFKRPGRDMNTAKDKKLDSQVEEYFELLMKNDAKTDKTGKLLNVMENTPKFGYIVCDLSKDLIEYNLKHNYFKKTPYNTLYKINESLNQYFEVMSYEAMVEFAEKRHNAFFQALGISNL